MADVARTWPGGYYSPVATDKQLEEFGCFASFLADGLLEHAQQLKGQHTRGVKNLVRALTSSSRKLPCEPRAGTRRRRGGIRGLMTRRRRPRGPASSG